MFVKLFVGVLATLAAVPAAVSALTITGPSSDYYWVFGQSNTIQWTTSSGDPNPISITITNPDNSILNGVFSIAQNVSVDTSFFTVTNVTLRPDSGYIVNFVNPTNGSDVYASSSGFTVQPAGTAPYGEEIFTIISYSVNGTVTDAVTIVETSTTLTLTTPSPTSSSSNSTGTITSSSTAGVAAATAQIMSKTSAASSLYGAGSFAASLLGAAFGALLLL